MLIRRFDIHLNESPDERLIGERDRSAYRLRLWTTRLMNSDSKDSSGGARETEREERGNCRSDSLLSMVGESDKSCTLM